MAERKPYSGDDTLRLALEVAHLGFWDHDLVEDRIYRSPEWARMLGFEPEEIQDHLDTWLDLVHPDDRPAMQMEVEAHERFGKPSFRIEHRMRTKEGKWRWILNWGRIVEWCDDGKPKRALGFHLDITDQKMTEAALARSEKLSTIGTLAGGIAHDFNNLLTVIQGNLQLSRMAADPITSSRHLEKAEKAVARSQELTARLLTFARGGKPRIEPVFLEGILMEARDLVLSGSRSTLSIECPADLPPAAGDPGQLLQVFQNLLLNARQAMAGGGTINVRFEAVSLGLRNEDLLEAGDYVSAYVQDDGPGIPPEEVNRIFDPFYTTRSDGKGLGLATAHSIVLDHGGLLEVVPDPGQTRGAEFRLLLPISSEAAVSRSPAAPNPIPGGGGRVLVMDDEELVREILVEAVRQCGFQPDEAPEGAMAVEMFKKARAEGRPYQVVMLDLTIPGGMGGRQAVEHIQAEDPEARVVVVSGYSDDPVMALYRDHGFCGSLAKPFTLGEVRQVLEKVLQDCP